MSNQLCRLCPLATGAQVSGFGPKDAKLIVVGDFPNNEDENRGIPFAFSKDPKKAKATGLARNAIKLLGLDPEKDVFWVHALRCNPYHRKEEIKVDKKKHIDICKTNLEADLREVTAPIVLLMGNVAVASVLGDDAKPGGVGPNRVFPKVVDLAGRKRLVITTYAPSLVDKRSLWTLDVAGKRDKRLSPTGSAMYFFKKDLELLKAKLQEHGLIPN